ncbi:MAG: guanylate kinase, partial [Muribaculaceae bacterium]|nr:guanylate kinase [Muribaculaceae bacterium]
LSLFICPPSIDALRQRLEGRGTDSPEEIDRRISKAAYEIEQGKDFETVVVNDVLDKAVEEVRGHIKDFIQRP